MCRNSQLCTAQDSQQCCVHGDTDLPGVVVGDRVCLYFEGCGCDNVCTCTVRRPSEAKFVVKKQVMHDREVCLNYPWENLIIAVVSWVFAVPLCVIIFKRTTLPRWTRTWQEGERGQFSQNPSNMMASQVVTQSLSLSGAGNIASGAGYGGASSIQPHQEVVITITQSDWWKASVESFCWNGFMCFFIIHGMYFTWTWVAMLMFSGHSWETRHRFVGINIVNCPFSLWPIWIGMWFMVSLAIMYLLSEVNAKVKSTTTVAGVAAGSTSDDRGFIGSVIASVSRPR